MSTSRPTQVIADVAGTVVRMPADAPHALEAPVATRRLLMMLKQG